MAKKLYDVNDPSTWIIDPNAGVAQSRITPNYELIEGVASFNPRQELGHLLPSDSKYDQGMPISEIYDVGEYRGQVQSNLDKWANATGKFALTAGTTFLDGTLGTAVGAVEMLSGGSFINNSFSNAMADISEWQERVLPNYYTKEELDNPWYSNLGTANFWADKVFKNLGFTVGAVYSGSAWAGATRGLLGTTKLANNVSKGLAKKFFDGNVDDAMLALKEGRISGDMLLGELAKDAKALKTHNYVQQAVGSFTGAIGESRIEAINNSREFEQLKLQELDAKMSAAIPQLEAEAMSMGLVGEDVTAYVEDRYNQEKAKLKGVVDAYRNMNFLMDAIVLTASNAIQFGRTFSGGYNNVKKAKGLINKAGTEELEVAKQGIVKKLPTYFKDAFVEGHEELAQGVIKETGDKFYAQKLSPEGDRALKSYAELFANQYLENTTNPDKWEEFIIGAFTGFLGTPSFGTGRMWSGGIFNAVAKNREEQRYAQEIATKWNEFVNSDRYKGVVRSLAYEQDKSKYLEEGNQFEYKNAENGQFVSDVITAMQADKFEDMLSIFEGMPNAAKPEEIRDMYKVSKDALGNEIPINERKGIFDNKTDDEIKSYVQERSKTLVQKAKEIRDIADNVEVKFGNIPQSVKETLVYYLSSIKDSESRLKDINKEITTIAPALNLAIDGIKTELVKNNGEISKDLKKTIEDTKKFVEDVEKNNPGTELVEAFNDLIKLEQRRIQFVNLYENAVTPEGLQKIQNTQRDFDKKNEDLVDKVDAQSKFTDGKDIVNKATGQQVGTLTKVGDEWRLVTYDDKGNVVSETKVDPTSKEFMDQYDTFEDKTVKQVKPKSYLDRETGEEFLVSPSTKKDGLFEAKNKKGNRIWELTKEQLDEKFVYNFKPDQETKDSYRRKSDGKTVIITTDVQGNSRIKEEYTDSKGIKRYRFEEISKEDLRKNYTHLKTFERKQSFQKVKNRSIQALENVLNDVEAKITQLDESIAKTEPIEFLRQELQSLQDKLDKTDRRQTQASIQRILEKMEELQVEIEIRTENVIVQEQELAKLRKDRDALYTNLQRLENWEEGQAHPINERIKELDARIVENQNIISLWKKSIQSLKKLINDIVNAFGLSSVYNIETEAQILEEYAKEVNQRVEDMPNADKLFGKSMAYAKAKLRKYIDSIEQRKLQLVPTAKKITQAMEQIDKFEKENEDLKGEIEILKDTIQEYRNLLKQEAFVKYRDPNATVPYLASIEGINGSTQTGIDNEDTSSTQLEKEEEALRRDRAARHPLDMFRGLRGRHYMDDKDTELNPNSDQRKYYRFTNNVDLSKGDYKLRLEFGESNMVEDRKYSNPLDSKPILAYVINKDGQYVDEFGNATDKANGVYSYIPSVEYPAEVYKPEGMSDTEFDTIKNRMVSEYIEAKTKIISMLSNNEEVTLPITGKSNGVPRTNFKELGDNTRTPLSELVSDTNQIKVIVATNKYTTIEGKQVRTKPGFVYIYDKSTGNILPVTPRKVSNKEIDIIVDLFKMYVSQASKREDGTLDFTGAGALKFMDSEGNLQPLSDSARDSMFKFLSDVMYWTQDNLTDEAKQLIKSNTLTRAEAFANPKYLVNKEKGSKQAFHFVPSSVPGGKIRLGMYSPEGIQLMENNGKGWVMHSMFEQTLREFLSTQYLNINSILTNDSRGFIAIDSVKKNDKGEYYVTVDNKYNKEGGYTQWLLDNNALESRIISNKIIDSKYNEPVPQVTSSYVIFDYSNLVSNNPVPSKPKFKVVGGNADLAAEMMAEMAGEFEDYVPEEQVNGARQALDELKAGRRIQLSPEEISAEAEAIMDTNAELQNSVLSEKEVSEVANADVIEKASEKLSSTPSTTSVLDYNPNVDPDDTAFMFRPSKSDTVKINMARATEWLHSVLGDKVSVRVSQHMLSGNNWGSYRKSIITLYENAGVGTEFHEAFHAVIDLFYSPEEKKKLFNTYKTLTGNNFNDKRIEEELAEDFANYMLGNAPAYLSKQSTVKGFFNRLFNFIKNMFGVATLETSNITDLFKAIENGKFASRPVHSSDLGMYSAAVMRSNIPGLSVYDKKEILEGVNANFFSKVFNEKDGLAAIFAKESNADIINNAYKFTYEQLGKVIASKQLILKNETNPTNITELTRQLNVLIAAHSNFREVIKMHRELLLQYNLEFVEDTWNKDVDELRRTKDSGQLWATESLKSSSKHNAGREIKLLLGSLPLVEPRDNAGNSKAVLNSIGLPMTVDFGRGFNVLINKLSGLTDWADMSKVLMDLSTDLPWVWVLGKRLGIHKSDDELTTNEITLRTQFQQTMAKTTNEFYMSMIHGNETTIISSNQNSFNKRRLREWDNNAKSLARGKNKYYIIEKDGTIKYNVPQFKGRVIADTDSALRFLKELGIEFSNEKRVKQLHSDEVTNRARQMLRVIQNGQGVLAFRDEEGGNAYEDLNTLANIERLTTVDAVENSLFNIDGEIVYGQTLNNYLSLVINEINAATSLDELYKKLPHLKSITSSLVLKGFKSGKVLGFRIHEGSAQKEYSGTKKAFEDLKPGDRLREVMYNYSKGNYALLRPADNGIERFLEMGKFFSRLEIMQEQKHLDTMVDYLQEELLDMRTLQKSDWNFVSKNFGKGLILDMIKTVDPSRAKDIVDAINRGESIPDYITRNKPAIKFALNKYFIEQVNTNKKLIVDNLLVEAKGNVFEVYGLPTKDKLTEAELDAFVVEFTANNLVANIEQVKLFAGNPLFYKNVEDQFKRNSGQVGTKKISIVSDYINNWIENHMDNWGLSPFTNGKVNGMPVLKTAILADVKTVSAELEKYAAIMGDKSEKYDEMDEGDAQGYIHLSEYRRMLMRAGDWTFGKGSLEEAYQVQIGRTSYIDPKTGEALFTIDKNRISKVVFNPLKPQHFGPLAEGYNDENPNGFIPGFYKLSVLPILPSMANNFPNLARLNKQMELQGVGLVVFSSGNKVGTKLNKNKVIQPVYNEKGEFNFDENNQMVTQNTYYKYWGIQVDMGNKSKSKVVWGTQMAKQIINSLTQYGQAIEGEFTHKGKKYSTQEIIDEYLKLNNKRVELGFTELLGKFGLEYDKNGELVSKNPQKLIDTLKEQAIADNLPDNIIASIESIAENGIDISPNRKKLEQVLMSMADKTAISQKTFGRPLVQVASTFFEENGIRKVRTKNKDGKVLTYYESNDLKSYGVEYNEKGEVVRVKSMQVKLPAIYEGITELGKLPKEARNLIGFRIPTQGLNSIESIEVVGFLPKEAGDIIVLPTEIVGKAGSDFDIDKLNVFLPNISILKDGSIRYIRDDKEQWGEYLLEGTLTEGEDKLMTWEQWQKKAIENELIELMRSIATAPVNAQQLLSPNQVDPIKEAANYIEYLEWKKSGKWTGSFDKSFKSALKKEKEGTQYNKIVELGYQMDLAERFLGGKSAVGITAVHSTFHILSQMNDLFIKPFYMLETKVKENGKWKTKEVQMPTKINMASNSDESNNIKLGGLTSKTGDSIVEELSMWINAAVDAAKDPFMFKLNAGPQTLNVVLYLVMAGVSRNNIALFMNQPIVKRYLELQRKYESIMADSTEANKGKKYKNEIEEVVLEEFGLSKFGWDFATVELNDDNLEKEFLNPTALQSQILSDFLRYQETAKILREVVQSITYDTAGAGKTTSELLYRLQSTEYIKSNELLGNYDKLIGSGFISTYYQVAQKLKDLMSEYATHLQNPLVVDAFNEFIGRYLQPNVTMAMDDITSAIEKFKEDLLVYVVMTTHNSKTGTNPLKNDFDRLFKGDKSMANRIKALQEKYPRNTLLTNLLPIFNTNTKGINNAKMYITKLETIESNQLTEDWRALYEGGEREFAKDLIKFVIIQAGLNNSPLNFVNLAPQEYYAEIMNSAITNTKLLTKQDLDNFAGNNGEFWLHHTNDKAIVPTRRTEGFPFYRSWNKELQEYVVYSYSTKQPVKMEGMPVIDFKNNSTAKRYGLMSNASTNTNEVAEDRSKKNIVEKDNSNEHDNICPTPY